MKQEHNNEIDLLIRKLGRQDNAAPQADKPFGLPDEEHLDADELNAYAENALPAAARARYTQHLATCTPCRQIASQLSLAAGLVVDEKVALVPKRSGISSFLAGLFTPIVLRYAVPSAALVLIVSIGVVVFQRNTNYQTDRLAKSNTTEGDARPLASPGFLDTQKYANDSQAVREEQVAKNNVGDEKQSSPNSKAVADSRGRVEEAKEETGTTTDKVSAASANAPVSNETAAAAKPTAAEDRTKAVEDVAQRQSPPAAAPAEPRDVRSNDAEGVKTPSKGRTGGAIAGIRSEAAKSKKEIGSYQTQAEERDEESSDRKRADKDDAKVISIAGRRFKKEGSVWIDVAYNSSPTVNVVRGSEQYRALVGDEPGLKSIAEQLSGEIIVVWKNRAYRIH